MRLTTRLTWWTSSLVALAFGFSGVANAGVMNFEGASMGSFLTAPFEQDGIRLSVLGGHYDLFDCKLFPCPPVNGIIAGLDSVQTGRATVRISLINGGSFNLDGIQILYFDTSSYLVASNGRRFDFVVSGQTFDGFRGIQWFDISTDVDIAGGFQFDNVSVSQVPEPSMVGLVLVALTGLVFVEGKSRHWPRAR